MRDCSCCQSAPLIIPHADLHEPIAHGLHQPQQQLRVARGRAARVLLVLVRCLALSPPLLLQLLQAGLQRLVALAVQQLLRAANAWAELTLLFRMRPALPAQRAATSARRAEARKAESAHHLQPCTHHGLRHPLLSLGQIRVHATARC